MITRTPDDLRSLEAWNRYRSTLNFGHIGRHLGLSRAAISQWRVVPSRHLAAVSEVTGIPPEILRPDLNGAPAPRIARSRRRADSPTGTEVGTAGGATHPFPESDT